jgi:hypothetical protein
MAPLSCRILADAGERLLLSASLAQFELRFLEHFREFPVAVESADRVRFVRVSATCVQNFSGAWSAEKVEVRVQPIRVCLEESHLRFVRRFARCFGAMTLPKELAESAPFFVRSVDIDGIQLVVSVAARSVIRADCTNCQIDLSPVRIRDDEMSTQRLVAVLVEQYTSDAIAAVPTLIASLSLIGVPLNIVHQLAAKFQAADSVLGGSMSVVRSGLKGIVKFANAMEETLHGLIDQNGETTGVGQGLVEMVALPTSALMGLVKRTGRLVLRTVGSTEEAPPKPPEPRALLSVPLEGGP